MYTLPTALQTAIDTGIAPGIPVELLEIEKVAGGFERRTNYSAAVTAFGESFLADGLWIGLSELVAAVTDVATTWEVELDLREATIVNANYQGGVARVWHTYLDWIDSSCAPLGEPVLMAEGEINVGDDRETLDRVARVLQVVSLQHDQFAPELHARTDRGQRDRFSGDRLFSETARLRRIAFRTGGGVKSFPHL